MREYVNQALTESAEERAAEEREKTGVPLGRTVTNPVNGEEIPVCVADYVLMEYGTGAIMAVPGPRPARLRVRAGLRARDPAGGRAARTATLPEGRGRSSSTPSGERLVNSGRVHRDAGRRGDRARSPTGWTSEGLGKPAVNYRLRDWLVSRQRYWGAPIPIVYCERDGIVPVPEDQLPVLLPEIEDYAPKGSPRWRRPRSGSRPSARAAAGRRGARPTRWTPSSTPPGTSCATATRATTSAPWDRDGVEQLDAGRPVHRRGRARDPAPDVRALLHQGARRHRTCSASRSRSPDLFTQG